MCAANQEKETNAFGRKAPAFSAAGYLRAGVAAIILSSASVFAQTYTPTYNTTSANVYWVNPTGSGNVSDPVSAQYNYPLSGQPNAGYATLSGTNPSGVPIITSGGYANSLGGGWVNTDTSFATTMVVGPGTSGLTNGTAVTLQLSLQLDGSTYVKTGDDAGYAQMSFNYRIFGPDRAVYDPGEGSWDVPRLFSFGASVRHSADNFYSCYLTPCGDFHDMSYTSGWDWSSNGSGGSSGSGGVVNEYDKYSGFSTTFSSSRSFDTGTVLVEFDTFVGDTLNIDSYLDVYGDTYGANSIAKADFLNTLQTSITSPFVSGLALTYGTVAAPVPEPEIYAMLGMGLGLLGWVGRRRKQQAA